MMEGSLVNLGGLSKPATVLIEKISDAVGGVFKPYQIVRVAKAEVEAERIREEARIQITDLHRRAMYRFLEEEAKRQSNIEEITTRALPLLEEKSCPEKVENDWITNFFDKSRLISDEDMQRLWSRVLAGEANMPGAFSKQTVNVLGDLDKADAELFKRFCGFVWQVGDLVPLVLNLHDKIYSDQKIYFNSLNHLQNLGLISFMASGGYSRLKLPKTVTAYYYQRPVGLTFPSETDNSLSLGTALLTRTGQQLAVVCGCEPVKGFFEYVLKKWEEQSLIQKQASETVVSTAS